MRCAISTWARLIVPVGSFPPSTRARTGYRVASSACSCGSSSSTRKRWISRTIASDSAGFDGSSASATVADARDVGAQARVLGAEAAGECGFVAAQTGARRRVAQRAERVEDHRDVDELLQGRAPHRRQVSERPRRPSRRATGRCRRARSRGRCGAPAAAMTTASPSRSRRSTVSTTSAASDDAVRSAGADRDADVGERERGRVVDAVADHDRRPGSPFDAGPRRPSRPACVRRAPRRRR